MAFECDVSTLEAEDILGGVALPIQCKRWKCEICAPTRQQKLKAEARDGEPTAFITLTIRRRPGMTTIEAAKDLQAAAKIFYRRFEQEQRKPAGSRYIPTGPRRWQWNRAKVIKIAKREDRKKIGKHAHFWVMEEHKSGWPHLHILWRGRYVPQWWLSQLMDELIQSYRVDVRRVKNPAQRAAYIAKYVGKKPHQFGTCKRYSQTRNYRLSPKWSDQRLLPQGLQYRQVQKRVPEVLKGWARKGRDVYQVSPRLFMWGELVDAVTGEIFARPPNATPCEFGVAWDD